MGELRHCSRVPRHLMLAVLILPIGITAPLAADPMPLDESWMAGRVMPAHAVAVDMASELLRANVRPVPGLRYARSTSDPWEVCIADVDVRYGLIADQAMTVPVLFPIVNGAAALCFRTNGAETPAKLVWDTDCFAAYQPAWRNAIESLISGDQRLLQIASDGLRLLTQEHTTHDATARRAGGRMSARVEGVTPRWRVLADLEYRLAELGTRRSESLLRDLGTYLLYQRDPRYGAEIDFPMSAEFTTRRKLLRERRLAVSFGAAVPDPIALWSFPEFNGGRREPPLVFAVAQLPLRAGSNEFEVAYTQPVSVRAVTRRGEHAWREDAQACEFDFVLRTAQLWRSFGTLDASVTLPEGSRYVDCTLAGARMSRDTRAPSVTLSSQGLPPDDLCVRFAAFEPSEPLRGEHGDTGGSSESTGPRGGRLRPLWRTVITDDPHSPASAQPVSDGSRVCASAGSDIVVCDANTGSIEQRLSTRADPVVMRQLDVGLALLAGPESAMLGGGYAPQLNLLDAGSGKPLVQAIASDGAREPVRTLLVSASIMVGAGVDGSVWAADTQARKPAWERGFRCRAMALSTPPRARGQALVVVGGMTLNRPDTNPMAARITGNIAALRPGDGSTVWQATLGTTVEGLSADDGVVYAAGNDGLTDHPFLACLDASTGAVRAKRATTQPAQFWHRIGSILVRKQGLVAIAEDGAFAFGPAPSFTSRWSHPWTSDRPTYSVCGDLLYVAGPLGLTSVDLRTGQTVWTDEGILAGSAICADADRLYAVSRNGGVLTAWQCPVPGERGSAVDRTGDSDSAHGQPPDDLAQVALRLPSRDWPEASTMAFAKGWRNGRGLDAGLLAARPVASRPGKPPKERAAAWSVAAAVVVCGLYALLRSRSRRSRTDPPRDRMHRAPE